MAPFGQDPAAIDQYDPVGGGNGGRPVGNDYRRLAYPGLSQRPHDL